MRRAAALVLLFAVAAQAQPEGVELRSKTGQYVVRFPGRPKESTQKAKTPLGDLTVHSATFATVDGNVLLVTHTDYPPAAAAAEAGPALIEGAVNQLAKQGKVVTAGAVAVGAEKVPGREVVVDTGKTQLRYRVFVKDSRLFQLGAVGQGAFVTGPEATAFFESFAFVK